MELSCPECGKVRDFRPATIARLKTHVCRGCKIKGQREKWVTVTCPQCGRQRKIAPSEARRGHSTGTCYRCPRHVPAVLPDTYDAGYVLGTVLGDGCLSPIRQKTGIAYTIWLSVTDRAFAERFREHLRACTGRTPWMTTRSRVVKANPAIGMPETRVTEWIVGLTCRSWYDRLRPYELDRRFDDLPARGEGFRRGLVQGMIDSEGYISPRGRLDIANKDLGLLAALVRVLETLGQKATVYGPYPYSRGVAHLQTCSAGWVKTTAKNSPAARAGVPSA